mgnify:FL=1
MEQPQELRNRPVVHLIPEDEDHSEQPVVHKSHRQVSDFVNTARLMQAIGAAVIKREAADINRKLLSVQERSNIDYDAPPSKRQRTTTDIPEDDVEPAVSYEEQVSIWNQVDRMQKMAIYLKNAKYAQDLFLRELQDCLDDAAASIDC